MLMRFQKFQQKENFSEMLSHGMLTKGMLDADGLEAPSNDGPGWH